MRRQESHALDAGDIVDRRKQVGEIEASRQVVTVGVDVLSQQSHLFHTTLDQPTDLVKDLGFRPTRLPPSAVWDDAEGAELVATVRNRHVGRNLRCVRYNGRQATVAVWVVVSVPQCDGLNDRLELLRSRPYVDLRESAFQVRLVRSHHATHHCQKPAGVPPLNRLQLAQ